jgi:hypothetical protein
MQHSRLMELAIKGLEAEKARIEQELTALKESTGARIPASRTLSAQPANNQPLSAASGKPRRKMSAAARKKISEAMKRSHAARKAARLRRSNV